MKHDHLFSFAFGSLISLGLWLACSDSRAMSWRGGSGGGINKILEEMNGVNETIYSNLNQSPHLPYCEDAQEFRESLEQWAMYFKKLKSMTRSRLFPTPSMKTLSCKQSRAPISSSLSPPPFSAPYLVFQEQGCCSPY
mmetsp:Transcript_26027/g.54090  ORF Transcript_26027/g.54090 Transcript_26027/m.54090 type:complete len:138 (-) Transcript_26027:142-555(-)